MTLVLAGGVVVGDLNIRDFWYHIFVSCDKWTKVIYCSLHFSPPFYGIPFLYSFFAIAKEWTQDCYDILSTGTIFDKAKIITNSVHNVLMD